MHAFLGALTATTRLCVALALLLAPWTVSMAARAVAAPEAVATVNVGNFLTTFAPASTTIAVGDTVHWVWTDTSNHSTTSGSCSGTCMSDGKWDSSQHAQSGFTFDHVFTQPGTYSYYCSVHGLFGMTGTIHVVGFLYLPLIRR